MLSCLRDTYFSKLDYVGRKEVVLKEIETIINCELTLNNIKLYTPTILIEDYYIKKLKMIVLLIL